MSNGKKVIVIGGGSIGVCSAYYLWKNGHDVTVLEKGQAGDQQGCSYGNAGLIVPSHFTPLAAPGVVWQGIKWMFDAQSPFAITPKINFSLLSWLWKFHQAANGKQVKAAAPVLRDLTHASRSLYSDLHEQENIDLGFMEKGLLMLCKQEETLEEERKTAERARELGIESNLLNAEEVQAMESQMRIDVLGGVYYPGDAHVIPEKFNLGMIELLQQKGVLFQYEMEVKSFRQEHGRLKSVETSQGELEAEEFVLAAGSWSPQLAKQLPVNLPMQPGKGHNLTLQNPPKQLKIPCTLCEARVVVTPMAHRLRFAGTMEIGKMDLKTNHNRIQGIIKSIPQYLPDFTPEWVENVQAWVGLRPCSPDGLPFIGRLNNCQNLTVATGHAMLGITLSPVTGHMVADIVSEKPPIVTSDLLEADRYN